MSDMDDYVLKGVTFTTEQNASGLCHGCVGYTDNHLCDLFSKNCVDKIWVIKEENKSEEYIKSIQEKYPEEDTPKKHSHYFKDVSNFEYIDVYRTLQIFGVTDPCIQHAAKKLLVTGNRGFKDVAHDIQDVIDTLERWKEMQVENKGFNDTQGDNNA